MNWKKISVYIGILSIITIILIKNQTEVMGFFIKQLININFEKHNDFELLDKYDFIIVGGGTAGCVLAARLSENINWKILLLEAGDSENFIMDIPIFAHYLQTSKKLNWMYETEPNNGSCLAMEKGRCRWPSGKVLGGSSVLNYMIYSRGNRKDYDRWSDMGNVGWSFTDVLPYFKRFENSKISESKSELYGRNGPVSITYNNYKSKIANTFVEGIKKLGLPENDYNGQRQVGVSYTQTTIKNGKRVSTNRAYLDAILAERKNLHLKKLSTVTKILINEQTKTANGIEFQYKNKKFTINVAKEIIISAGAIKSPQLLMLSGIGPEKHLTEMDIKTIANLPVGLNLMDHVAAGYFLFTTNVSSTLKNDLEKPTSLWQYYKNNTGPVSVNSGIESIAFFKTTNFTQLNGYPDVGVFLVSGTFYDNKDLVNCVGMETKSFMEMFRLLEMKKSKGFTIGLFPLRPNSRGKIELQSINPLRSPLIYSNYYNDKHDMNVALNGIRKILELENTDAFKSINAKLQTKQYSKCQHYEYGSDQYWNCFVRHFSFSLYHYSGTCKMGAVDDRTAVVDPKLRVIGIKNLRVADASIIPTIISGHPISTVFMIGEKASDLIKMSWK